MGSSTPARLTYQKNSHLSRLKCLCSCLQKLDERERAARRAAQESLLAEQLAKLRDDKLRDEKER